MFLFYIVEHFELLGFFFMFIFNIWYKIWRAILFCVLCLWLIWSYSAIKYLLKGNISLHLQCFPMSPYQSNPLYQISDFFSVDFGSVYFLKFYYVAPLASVISLSLTVFLWNHILCIFMCMWFWFLLSRYFSSLASSLLSLFFPQTFISLSASPRCFVYVNRLFFVISLPCNSPQVAVFGLFVWFLCGVFFPRIFNHVLALCIRGCVLKSKPFHLLSHFISLLVAIGPMYVRTNE